MACVVCWWRRRKSVRNLRLQRRHKDADSKLVFKTGGRLNGIGNKSHKHYMPSYLVISSNLHGVDYEPWSATLTITFLSGWVYEYYGVPASVVEGLIRADSPGRYHHEHIKNHYSYQRIA